MNRELEIWNSWIRWWHSGGHSVEVEEENKERANYRWEELSLKIFEIHQNGSVDIRRIERYTFGDFRPLLEIGGLSCAIIRTDNATGSQEDMGFNISISTDQRREWINAIIDECFYGGNGRDRESFEKRMFIEPFKTFLDEGQKVVDISNRFYIRVFLPEPFLWAPQSWIFERDGGWGRRWKYSEEWDSTIQEGWPKNTQDLVDMMRAPGYIED